MKENLENNLLSEKEIAGYYFNSIERSMDNFLLNDIEKGLIRNAFGITDKGIVAGVMNEIVSYNYSMVKGHRGTAILDESFVDNNLNAGKDAFLYLAYNKAFHLELNPNVDKSLIKSIFFHEMQHLIHFAVVLIKSKNKTVGEVFDFLNSDLFTFQSEFFSFAESASSMISEVKKEKDWKDKVYSSVKSNGNIEKAYERARIEAGNFESVKNQIFNFLSEKIGQDLNRPNYFNLLPEADIIFQGIIKGMKKSLLYSKTEDEFKMFNRVLNLASRQDSVEKFFQVLLLKKVNVGSEIDLYKWFAGQESYKMFYSYVYSLKNLQK